MQLKKLYVLAALEVEAYRKKVLSSAPAAGDAGQAAAGAAGLPGKGAAGSSVLAGDKQTAGAAHTLAGGSSC